MQHLSNRLIPGCSQLKIFVVRRDHEHTAKFGSFQLVQLRQSTEEMKNKLDQHARPVGHIGAVMPTTLRAH